MSTQVDVLMPCYNRIALLPETIESILTQTLPVHSIILVDDGSKEDVQAAIAPFGSHVRYHRVENGGPSRARNIAASLSTASHLAFCDSDDLWLPDKNAEQMELHHTHPDLHYSFTNFSIVQDGTWLPETKFDGVPADAYTPDLRGSDAPVLYDQPIYRQLLEFQPIFTSTIVLTHAFFHRLNGFNEAFSRVGSEDFEFTLRCVQHAPIGIVRKPLVGVRKHDANFSGDPDLTTRGEVEILQHALLHHNVDGQTQEAIQRQIDLRNTELAHGAFERGDFSRCQSLLQSVPPDLLTGKQRLKSWIAKTPPPVARLLHATLVRS